MFTVSLLTLAVLFQIQATTPQILDETSNKGSRESGLNVTESQIDPSFFVTEIFEKYGDRNTLTYEGFEHLLENLGLGLIRFEEEHDVSIHRINGTFEEMHDVKDLHKHSHGDQRQKRHTTALKIDENGYARRARCLSPDQILASYGLKPGHGVIISTEGFQSLCPAIVYELDQKHCRKIGLVKADTDNRHHIQVWLEASMSILIMSISGLLCAAVVPLLKRCEGQGLQFLVALAAGTLAGDALIHLLPHALMFDPNLESENTPLLRATTTLLSIVIFYFMEAILRTIQKPKPLKGSCKEVDSLDLDAMLPRKGHGGHTHGAGGSLSCVVIAGDILHNMTDGLSIGAAFSTSQGAGFACAVAVFCHELPHELGDYAILLKEGMGVKKALLCNVFSSIFSFIGMAIGLLLGEVMHAAPWVNSFTAGSFLYIALANLAPELKKDTGLGATLLQLTGLTSGILLMFFIGLYEDDWEKLMTS